MQCETIGAAGPQTDAARAALTSKNACLRCRRQGIAVEQKTIVVERPKRSGMGIHWLNLVSTAIECNMRLPIICNRHSNSIRLVA